MSFDAGRQMMNLNNLEGKTVLITGATSGIGLEAARALARLNPTLVLVSRSEARSAATAERIREESGNPRVEYLVADLSAQAQVRELAAQFQSRYDRLDVLINNAGGLFATRQLSVDGIEMTFALDHLSYFLLTNLLLDMLKDSAPSRIVNVASHAHFDAPLDFDDLQMSRGYIVWKAYDRAKFANILFTYELARRLEGTGVTVNALHPGIVRTNIGKSANWFIGAFWNVYTRVTGGLTPAEGARTTIYLAASPDVEGVSGKYFDEKQQITPSDPATYDEDAARRLWKVSAEMVGLAEE
jgi:NAD(P)-dependent dehydrogenase (short-subunit alcohol dehydrogenase family)